MQDSEAKLQLLFTISRNGTLVEYVHEDDLKKSEALIEKAYIAILIDKNDKVIKKKNTKTIAFHLFKKTCPKPEDVSIQELYIYLKARNLILKMFPKLIELEEMCEREGQNTDYIKGLFDGGCLLDPENLRKRLSKLDSKKSLKNHFQRRFEEAEPAVFH